MCDPTGKQKNGQGWKHNLLGRGNNIFHYTTCAVCSTSCNAMNPNSLKRTLYFKKHRKSPETQFLCGFGVVAQFLSLYCTSFIFCVQEQETDSQWTVSVCVCVLISPPRLRTLGSMLRLHTHLSVFAPRRTDMFPFFLPLCNLNPFFSGFPILLHHSISSFKLHHKVIFAGLR